LNKIDQQREAIAQTLLDAVANDTELKGGDLPWRMTEAQWTVFKLNPERFRKPMPLNVLECSECGNRFPREELLFESEHVRYCKSCLSIQ
jgi:hypothetical protein